MSDEIARLGIEVDSRQVKTAAKDLENLTASGGKAEGAARRIGREFDSANKPLSQTAKGGKGAANSFDDVGKSARGASRETGALTSSLKSLVAPLAAYLGTREIAKSAEQWTQLNNRLSLVTDSTEELVDAQKSVFEIAQNARQPLGEAAELYQRIATNADALKLSGSGVAEVVDKISKTLAISGTSGAAASAALTQLGQAFASGTLRGEELNSVLEQAPALAKSIADGLGVTIGELRALGAEGQLTADTVINALLDQGDVIDEQFGKIQATGSQAFTVLGNSITRVIGEIDQATGASGAFANSILEFSNYLDNGGLVDGVIESFNIWALTIDNVAQNLGNLESQLGFLSDAGTGAADFIVDAFKNLPANVKSFIELMVIEIAAAFDKIKAYAVSFKDGIKAVFTDDTLDAVGERLTASIDNANAARKSSISAILEERDATIAAAAAERARREEETKASEQRREAAKSNLGAGATGQVPSLGGGESDAKIVDLAKIRDQLATEDQAIESSFVKRQDALAEYLDNSTIMQDEYNSLTLANVTKYNEEMKALEDKRREEKLGALEDSFNNLQISAMSETELEEARYTQQLDTLKAAKAAGLEAVKSYNELEQDLLTQHQERLNAITQKGLTDRQKFQALGMKDQAKEMFSLLGQQTQAAAQHNKTAFEANKVAAIANATISTYEGVAKAWSFGPILGPIFAGIVAAAGLANVQAISSQSFGGGGGGAVPSVAATGATSAVAVTNQGSGALQAQQPQQEAGPRVVLNFSGPVTGLDEDVLAEKITELMDRDYIQGFS